MEQHRPENSESSESNPVGELPENQKFRAGDRIFLKKDPTREWYIIGMKDNNKVMLMNEDPKIGHSFEELKTLDTNFEVKPGESLHDTKAKPAPNRSENVFDENSRVRKKN